MRVTIESTSKIVELKTASGIVPARVWEGKTDSGIPVHALVTRIAVERSADATQFERELMECAVPSAAVENFYPTRIVL